MNKWFAYIDIDFLAKVRYVPFETVDEFSGRVHLVCEIAHLLLQRDFTFEKLLLEDGELVLLLLVPTVYNVYNTTAFLDY